MSIYEFTWWFRSPVSSPHKWLFWLLKLSRTQQKWSEAEVVFQLKKRRPHFSLQYSHEIFYPFLAFCLTLINFWQFFHLFDQFVKSFCLYIEISFQLSIIIGSNLLWSFQNKHRNLLGWVFEKAQGSSKLSLVTVWSLASKIHFESFQNRFEIDFHGLPSMENRFPWMGLSMKNPRRSMET